MGGLCICFGVCLETSLGLREGFIGCAEVFHKVSVVETAFVIAGCILEAEGGLLSLVLFPVALGMKPCVLQGVGRGAEAGYRVVLCGMVHLTTRDNVSVGKNLTPVKGSLRRGHV